MVFRMLQNGVATPFKTYAAGSVTEIWDNFMGAPSVYFVFSVPQDNIKMPADFNASASAYLRDLWNGNGSKGTLTGPDSSGYYTATLTTVTIPDDAVMLTGGLGYSYGVGTTLPLTQTNLISYPVAAAVAGGTVSLTAGMPNKTGGLIVIAPDVQVVAKAGCVLTANNTSCTSSGGYTGRRAVVEDARCNNCHQELGVFTAEAFHAGQRNDGTTCSWCHNPNRTSSGWSADAASFVHGIHAASVRADKFTWHAASVADGFWSIGYPGVVNKCEACHLPGTYDFAASANANAVPNRPYRTVATGIFPASGASVVVNSKYTAPVVTTPPTLPSNSNCGPASASVGTALSAFSLSPYVTPSTSSSAVTQYGIGFGVNLSGATTYGCKPDGTLYSIAPGATIEADGNSLVNSPITTACVSCHDSKLAQDHMKREGGSIYAPRSTALGIGEGCMVCHATGKVADIKLVHSN
jgi:OmcA/MtrC family decaheme c-type cytochrome